MIIDLNKVTEKGIDIDEIVSFNEEYLKNTTIKECSNIKVKGRIYLSSTMEIVLSVNCAGNLILKDARTLEDITYPFNINIDEVVADISDELTKKVKNSQNTLDILNILWQNIVLEVPIRITKGDFKDMPLEGEGWRLTDE